MLARNAASLLVLIVAVLALGGLTMIYSATSTAAETVGAAESLRYAYKQGAFLFLSAGLCVMMAWVDYKSWGRIMWWLVGLAALTLILVYVPHVGKKVKGASRWIAMGGLQMQPSEFAKVVIVMFLAWWHHTKRHNIREFVPGCVIPAVVVGGLTALILGEVDLGMTLLIAVTVGAIWVTIGMRWMHLGLVVLLGGTMVAGVFVTNPERRSRVMAHFSHKTEAAQEEAKKGAKYQQHQSVVALGSGGWDGLGFGESRQKLFYVPEAHTDCIGAIIGEELGLRTMLLALLCYVAFVVCAGAIAATAADLQGFILALGAACLVGIAAVVNIGVVSGVLPNKGMALPFVSYGGSNLMANAMLTGLLISVWRHGHARTRDARLTLGWSTAPA